MSGNNYNEFHFLMICKEYQAERNEFLEKKMQSGPRYGLDLGPNCLQRVISR